MFFIIIKFNNLFYFYSIWHFSGIRGSFYKKLKKSYSIKQNIQLKVLKNTKYITQKEKKN